MKTALVTDMMQDRYRDRAAAMSPFNRNGDPREVADIAVFLASDAARWMTGQNPGAGGSLLSRASHATIAPRQQPRPRTRSTTKQPNQP